MCILRPLTRQIRFIPLNWRGLLWAAAFVATAACVILVPRPAAAERVGVIITSNEDFHVKAHQAFEASLKRLGIDKRVSFLVQRPHPDPIAWSNAVRKLVAADVDIMVTYGARATLAAVRERTNIPIIYADVYEPVARRITSRFATGVCSKYSVPSVLRYMKRAGAGNRIGVIYTALEEDSEYQFNEIKELSGKYSLTVVPLQVRSPLDAEGLVSRADIGVLVITSSSIVRSVFPTLMRVTQSRRIPIASLLYHEDPKPVITLSGVPEDHGEAAAEKLAALLNGTAPKDIPVTCSRKITLVFNAREARKLGIRIPMDLVTEATRIIY